MRKTLRKFIANETAGGQIMILFAALALLAANSPLSGWYFTLEPTKHLIQDGLMVLFFFTIALELKREMTEGVLAKRGQILLPALAALGGMAVPAGIYLALNIGQPENHAGWAIPSATDIAFALCILSFAGKNVPPAIKIFLLAIAIFDDLGAIAIIALFYNNSLSIIPLLLAGLAIFALIRLNKRNVACGWPYLFVGIYLVICLYFSGIHTTLAGVAVGLAIPMRRHSDPARSPLTHILHIWHPWVNFLILPLFAFTHAGVSLAGIDASALTQPLPLGILLGLFLGKQLGIFATSWLVIITGLASKPKNSTWAQLYGVSIIAGIGFTMSLFIGMLAFSDDQQQELVKLGVIAGSVLSALWGILVMRLATLSSSKG
ncbi:MAG: Na+/H+ antiporter NhaA [Rickettsiales bacterium]|nr:Na+/H+ antiporter NhaA [Rickettsiales bacterium]